MELRTIRQDKQQSKGGNWELGVGILRIKIQKSLPNGRAERDGNRGTDRRSSVPLATQSKTIHYALGFLPFYAGVVERDARPPTNPNFQIPKFSLFSKQ